MSKRFEITLQLGKNKEKMYEIAAKDKHQAIACAIHWAWGEAAETVRYHAPVITHWKEFHFIDYCVGGVTRSGHWDEVIDFKCR